MTDDAAGGPPLAWHAATLLPVVRGLRDAETLAALRAALAGLRDALDTPAMRPQPSDDSIVFAPERLHEALEQIGSAQTIERAHHYADRLLKALTEERVSPINDINLNRWKEYDDVLTDSLWNIERRDRTGAHSADYWGNFIPQIPNQMMRRYTKRGEWVLDVFAGSGTTLIEAQKLGRNCLGIELQPHVAERTNAVLAANPNPHDVSCTVATGDSASADYLALLAQHGVRSVQLVMMHPPYFDIIKFSDDSRDLSNAASVETFLAGMGQVAERAAAVLDRGRYLALVIGDKYARGEWIPLGFHTMNEVQARGFTLKSIVVKNFEDTTGKRAQKELWKYRALVGGFYVFKHEYIFVFKKK